MWYFNNVLHIPGKPRLVLISDDNYDDSQEGDRGFSELVEVNGQFFFVSNDDFDAQVIEGDSTLEEVLAGLRGDLPLGPTADCSLDWKAIDIQGAWRSRAYKEMLGIAGEVVY